MILFALILVSCSNQTIQRQITVDLNNPKGRTMINDLFEDFEYIALQTTDSSLFGALNKLVVFEDKYYILDQRQMRKVLVFEKDGSFSHTIGAVGNGPGEYSLSVEDFTIDKERRRIVFLTQPSTIFIYDLNGAFIEKKIFPYEYNLWNICQYENGFVCSTNHQKAFPDESPYVVYLLDKDFNLKEKRVDAKPEKLSIYPMVSNLLEYNGKIAYFDEYTYTMYPDVTNNEKPVSLHFKFDNQVPFDLFVNYEQYLDEEGDYSTFIDAAIVEETLIAYFINKMQQYILIMKLDGSITLLSGSYWLPSILYNEGGYVYSVISPSWILEDATSGISADNKTKYPIEIDSNPVIMRFKIKEKWIQ